MAAHVFTNGTIITMAGDDVDAIAFENGVITAVGSEAQRLGEDSANTVHDLQGKTLLPGFIEAHGHPTQAAILLSPPAIDIRPFTVPTGPQVTQLMQQTVAAAQPGEALVFMGIDPLLHQGIEVPTIQSLDTLAPNNPIVVISNSGHAAYGNSAAFAKAGITKDTPDPTGATYVHDASGELTGEAQEVAALLALAGPLLNLEPSELAKKILWATQQFGVVGITTVSEMGYERRFDPLFESLASDPTFPVRIRAFEMSTPALAADATHVPPPVVPPEELFSVIGMKIWADGSPWQGNIKTSFPYIDSAATRSIGLEPGHKGDMNYTPEQIESLATAFATQGWQVACHVHGDLAINVVLDAYEKALAQTSHKDLRLRMEHCGAMTPEQFKRAADLGVTVSLFIAHVYYWGDVLVDGLFGPRGEQWMSSRSALDAGLRISFHNDGPVTPASPLGNICTAVTRHAKNSGRVLDAQECITVEQALRAQTIDAAYQLHLDDAIGSLEKGKRADFVILNEDPRAVTPEQIRNIQVLATFLGGRPTYSAGQSTGL